jgi:hypothetical protein
VTLTQIVGPAANQTVGIPTPAEQQAKYEAVIDAVNASGGVACRKVVARYLRVNPADQSHMHQKCLDIAQAGEFAVLDDGREALAPDCFGQNRILYIGDNLLFAASAKRFFPYLFSPFALYDSAYQNMVFGLRDRGSF